MGSRASFDSSIGTIDNSTEVGVNHEQLSGISFALDGLYTDIVRGNETIETDNILVDPQVFQVDGDPLYDAEGNMISFV